jgi:transcriptional regulator with XRE-family HTH domain
MDESGQKPLGTYLKRIREGLPLAAKEVALRAGMKPSYLSEIETGKRKATDALMARLAPALSMTLQELKRAVALLQEEDRMCSPALNEDAPVYRSRPRQTAPQSPSSYAPSGALCPDMEALVLHLLAEKGRDDSFSMLREFTEAAQNGDELAFAKARALLVLLPKIQ